MPKRSEERRRRNKTDSSGNPNQITKVEIAGAVEQPKPNPNWGPAAMAIWNAACESGQTIFFEPSDWALLALTCSQIDQEYRNDLIIEKVKLPMHGQGEGGGEELVYGSRPMPAGKFAAIVKALGDLGFSEGARRRMQMELTRNGKPPEEQTKDVVINAQNRFLTGGR